jgi:hypothetical protein
VGLSFEYWCEGKITVLHGIDIYAKKYGFDLFGDNYMRTLKDVQKGKLPDGSRIPAYNLEDVEGERVKDPFGEYVVSFVSVVSPGDVLSYGNPSSFESNSLMIARAGSRAWLQPFWKKTMADAPVWKSLCVTYPSNNVPSLVKMSSANAIHSRTHNTHFLGVPK